MSACGTLALFPFPGVHCCESNFDCALACLQAQGSRGCSGVTCHPELTRCVCPGAGVLTADGGCEEAPPEPPEGCEPGFAAELNVAVYASPELHGAHVATGISPPFESLLRRSVGAAMGYNASEVVISSVSLTPVSLTGGSADASGSLLHLDLAFSFCPPGPELALQSPVPGDQFAGGFVEAAQRFATLAPATMSFTAFQPTLHPNTSAAPPLLIAQGSPGAGESDPSYVDEVLVLSLLCILLCALSVVACVLCVKRRRRKVQDEPTAVDFDAFGPEGGQQEAELLRAAAASAAAGHELALVGGGPATPSGAEAAQLVMAKVAYDFSPDDVETDGKLFREACLQLQEGDIVEVVAGGGGWFYGRAVGAEPQRQGFFPESFCSWISAVPAGREVASPEQHMLVSVQHGFVPDEVKEETAFNTADCLEVAEGEIVEVLAGGAGWLFGRVAGQPERVGYLPENRTVWLGQQEPVPEAAGGEVVTADATALHSTGFYAQVQKPFYPGVPGDAVEESVDAFCDSCIAVAEGDVVEVLAAGGGWLYGRLVGDPERVGYFPEARISWVGRPEESQPGPAGPVADAVGDAARQPARELWHCPACDEPNGAERPACNNCGRAREAAPQARWACPSCEEPNRADRPLCNNCKRPRPAVSAGTGCAAGSAASSAAASQGAAR